MSGTNRRPNFPDGLWTSSSKMTGLETIGSGGFGVVYKAEHEDWGTVAYKKLPLPFIPPTHRAVRQMVREVEILKDLRHPNIVTISGVVFEDGNYGIVLEFMSHGNASSFFDEFQVPIPWKVRMTHDIVLGMNYLHRLMTPIIHGDLKIQNVLVTNGYQAKITDFGLSHWKGMSRSSSQQADVTGTVTHIAPEKWNDANARPSEKEDIYAFGVLLWEIFSEGDPFQSLNRAAISVVVCRGQRPNISQLPDDLPLLVRSTIDTSWSANPEDRKSFKDIKIELDGYISSHEDEICTARNNIRPRRSSSSSSSALECSLETDGSSLPSVATNENLPIQRADTGTRSQTDSRGTCFQQMAPTVTADRVTGSGASSDSSVLVKTPVSVLDPGPGRSIRSAPGDLRPVAVSSIAPPPSLCRDDDLVRTDFNLDIRSFRFGNPIQETQGESSVTQNAATSDPVALHGTGLISLHPDPRSLAPASGRTHIKELDSDRGIPLCPSVGVVAERFVIQNPLLSVAPSHPPLHNPGDRSVAAGGMSLRSLREPDVGTGGRGAVDTEREAARTVVNRPLSVPEADAILTPNELEVQNERQRLYDRQNSQGHQDRSSDLLKVGLDNWNRNAQYNNLDATKGYFPKDGGAFKEHVNETKSAVSNLNFPSGQSGNAAPSVGGNHPYESSGTSRATRDGSGLPPGKPTSHHNISSAGKSSSKGVSYGGTSSSSPVVTLRRGNSEIIVSGPIGPNVQFGDNNTMHITMVDPDVAAASASAFPSQSGFCSFGGRQSSSRSSKEPAKKEKIIVPDRLVDADIIVKIADELGNDWTRLARELGFRDSDISAFEVDYRHLGVREIAYQMLRDWVEKKGPTAKLDLLARALVGIRRHDIALKFSSGAQANRRP